MFEPSRGLCLVLQNQHARIESQFYPLLAPRAECTGELALSRFAALSALLRRHMEIEDKVLFPAVERIAPARDRTVIAKLRTEHRELEWGLDYLWSMINGAAEVAAIRSHLGSFDDLLARHIAREQWVILASYPSLAASEPAP